MQYLSRRLPITVLYALMTATAFGVYTFLSRLPEAAGTMQPVQLLAMHGSLISALSSVWFIFAWGFGVQALVQTYRVFHRLPKEAGLVPLVRHGVILSVHAGIFEELIFRLYAFLSFIIAARVVDAHVHGWLKFTCTAFLLPVANFLSFGLFRAQFITTDWAIGLGIILGSLFFRSAHMHYGNFAKANVWIIGLVMFWLLFHFGLAAAILAHVLYDAAVFAAIILTSPLQPKPLVD